VSVNETQLFIILISRVVPRRDEPSAQVEFGLYGVRVRASRVYSQHYCSFRGCILVMFTVNRLTENFRLTGFSINRTETGNMATALSAKIFF